MDSVHGHGPDGKCSVWRLLGVFVHLNVCTGCMLDGRQITDALAHDRIEC